MSDKAHLLLFDCNCMNVASTIKGLTQKTAWGLQLVSAVQQMKYELFIFCKREASVQWPMLIRINFRLHSLRLNRCHLITFVKAPAAVIFLPFEFSFS